MELTVEELIHRMDQSLRDMALADIKRAARPGETEGAKLAGFLLGFCFIDAVAGFHAGRTQEVKGTIGADFRGFVNAYMPTYDAGALYDDLRNGLVHSYAIGQTYAFTHLESDGRHLETTDTNLGERTLLNLEEFIDDLERAYGGLRRDIRNDPDQFARAQRRYASSGLIRAA